MLVRDACDIALLLQLERGKEVLDATEAGLEVLDCLVTFSYPNLKCPSLKVLMR